MEEQNMGYAEENRVQRTQQQQIPSVKDWLVTLLIMCVPFINIVMLFVWGFGDQTNKVRANYAKATLLMVVISFVFSFVLLLGLGALLASSV